MWTSTEGIAYLDGALYPYVTQEDCKQVCFGTPSCIAVDVSAVICLVHTNVNATRITVQGYTHYTLNRTCPSSTTLQSTIDSMVDGDSLTFGK